MANAAKRKGDKAELEVQTMLSDLLGVNARRALGAGRLDDVGDIHGIPHTVIQVVNRADINVAIRLKMPELERQMGNAQARFGAVFARRRGGQFVVVQTPEQWASLWLAAQ
jgi:hypothetical protein